MRTAIGLVGFIAITASVTSGISAPLGTGPESIMGLSANETTLYTSVDENTYLSVTRLDTTFPSLESVSETPVPSLNLNYTGKGTDGFYHLSLINREDDFHGVAGIAFDNFSVVTHFGDSDGSVSNRLGLDGIAPNFFHGSVSYGYYYGSSTLGVALSEDLSLHGGASFIEAEGLDSRSVYSSGLSYKGFYATFNHVQRDDESVGYSVITGLDIGDYSVSYQELSSEYGAAWREVSVGLSDDEKLSRLKLSLGVGNNENYYAGDETRLTLMYSIPLGGGETYSRTNRGASFNGNSSQLARSASTFQGLKQTSLGAVGSALSLSSGSEILDGKGQDGMRFMHQHSAALTTLSRWNPVSIEKNREIGGMVYRNRDGSYGINSNVRIGTHDRLTLLPMDDIPIGTTLTASWHTHAAYDPLYDSENFSYTDIKSSNYWQIDAYLGTPMGRVQWYDIKNDRIFDTGPGVIPTQ